jgi:sugar phosphate permease
MNFQNKIDEIRNKPEHIRIRYALVFTAIFTILIVIIWFFSIKGQESKSGNSSVNAEEGEIINQFQEQKKSMQNVTEQMKNTIKNQAPVQDTNQ